MTKQQRVERLQFAMFRGATLPVSFQFRGEAPVVLIFGENGTGKSTIADAIDFLCNNAFGSLSLRSGVRNSQHIVSSRGQASGLYVEMDFAGNSWRATLSGSRPVTSPADPPRAFVLRRADITRIMEATDSDRYKQLQEFITVPHIEQSEKTLRDAARVLDAELQQAMEKRQNALATLTRFWEAEGLPEDDPIRWARTVIKQPLAEVEQQIAADKTLLAAIDQAVQAEQSAATAGQQLRQAQSMHRQIEEQLLRASQSRASADLATALQAARSFLDAHPEANHCPVCTKPEPRTSLLAQIDTQLAQLQAIQDLQTQLEQSEAVVQQANGVFGSARDGWRAAYGALATLVPAAPRLVLPAVTMPFPQSPDVAQARSALHEVVANRPALERRIQQATRVVDQRNALKTHLAAIDELASTVDATQTQADHLNAMLAIVEQERKQYVQSTVDSISGTVSALYQRVHPDEPLGELSFGLKAKTRGSLTLTSRFGQATNVSPAAYYSESHLDTLGLCVYLALAKQSGNALVVLDDVLMSVDDPHLDRIIDLISDEAAHFGHVLITTHSRAWFDRMRLGQGMQAELIELYGWDLHSGMHHSQAPLALDELRTAVENRKLDRQAVASRSGVLLEQLLDELTLRYGCSLPRKRPAAYTLGELSQGFDRKLRSLLRTEHLDDQATIVTRHDLDPLIVAASSDSWIRNQVGAHFNPNAAGISDSMVRKFGENVVALGDALICVHCHQLPRKNKSGSYWECGGGCGRIRLYPLSAPK